MCTHLGVLTDCACCVSWPLPGNTNRHLTTGYIVVYGNLQAATTKLYKTKNGKSGQPTGASAYKWAAYCSLVPLVTGM